MGGRPRERSLGRDVPMALRPGVILVMVELTEAQKVLLARYEKLADRVDSYSMGRSTSEASNVTIGRRQAEIASRDLTDNDLVWLQGLARRQSRNFKRIRYFSKLHTFAQRLMRKTLS